MTTLCFIDTETTGLDARIHQPYEVCWWREDQSVPSAIKLGHSLVFADAQALTVGRYWERGNYPFVGDDKIPGKLADELRGVTLVGSNPAFDAAMLTRFIGAPVWHHRLINVAEGAMSDHTAEGDVRTTRAVYYALRAERGADQ